MTLKKMWFEIKIIAIPAAVCIALLLLFSALLEGARNAGKESPEIQATNIIIMLTSIITAGLAIAAIIFARYELRLKSTAHETAKKKLAVYRVLLEMQKNATTVIAYPLKQVFSAYKEMEKTRKIPTIKNEDELEELLYCLMTDRKADSPVEERWVPLG